MTLFHLLVADKCNDQSLENDELMSIYGPSGNTEERREEPGFPEDNLSRPISNSQKRATISRYKLVVYDLF